MGIKATPKLTIRDENQSRVRTRWNFIRQKIINLLFYAVYTRLLLESNETMVLSTISEINTFDTSSTPAIISLTLALCLAIVLSVFLCYAWFLAYKLIYNFDPDEKFFFMEFFADLKPNKRARFYTPLLLLRRFVFVLVIIPMAPVGRHFIFSFLLIFNIPYLLFIALVKPFEEGYENLIETMNE